MCDTYNLIYGPVQMLVNHHFLTIKSRMEVIRRYSCSYIPYFGVDMEIIFSPVRYKLDRLWPPQIETFLYLCTIYLSCVISYL